MCGFKVQILPKIKKTDGEQFSLKDTVWLTLLLYVQRFDSRIRQVLICSCSTVFSKIVNKWTIDTNELFDSRILSSRQRTRFNRVWRSAWTVLRLCPSLPWVFHTSKVCHLQSLPLSSLMMDLGILSMGHILIRAIFDGQNRLLSEVLIHYSYLYTEILADLLQRRVEISFADITYPLA